MTAEPEERDVERLARLLCEEAGWDPHIESTSIFGRNSEGDYVPWRAWQFKAERARQLLRVPADHERRALARLREEG